MFNSITVLYGFTAVAVFVGDHLHFCRIWESLRSYSWTTNVLLFLYREYLVVYTIFHYSSKCKSGNKFYLTWKQFQFSSPTSPSLNPIVYFCHGQVSFVLNGLLIHYRLLSPSMWIHPIWNTLIMKSSLLMLFKYIFRYLVCLTIWIS